MPAMLILALETSTDLGTCALWRDGEVCERVCPTGRPHSETLLPLVRELLATAGARVQDLDAIAFGVGPGAFTGLRVACGAAQGLAVVAETPLLPMVSLEVMAAASQAGAATSVMSLLDARMGEVYVGRYQQATSAWQVLGPLLVQRPEAIELPAAGWHVCGNALNVYPMLSERLAAAGATLEPGIVPRAGQVAMQAVPRVLAGEGIDPALAAPLYVRDKVAKTVAERLAEGGRA